MFIVLSILFGLIHFSGFPLLFGFFDFSRFPVRFELFCVFDLSGFLALFGVFGLFGFLGFLAAVRSLRRFERFGCPYSSRTFRIQALTDCDSLSYLFEFLAYISFQSSSGL